MVESDIALVELIPCAALLYYGAGEILSVNRMFCDLVGYEPDELLCRRIADLTGPGERQLDDAAWLIELVSKDGRTIPCEVKRKCLNGDGPMQCLVLVRRFSETARQRPEPLPAGAY